MQLAKYLLVKLDEVHDIAIDGGAKAARECWHGCQGRHVCLEWG